MMQPRFSIVMPMYNASAFLTAAIGSVKAQTLDDWELIVVDDASTDSSLAAARELAGEDERIKVMALKENSGSAFRPRLAALQAAAGEYIVELDADDTVEPDYLLKLSRALADKTLDAAFAQFARPDGSPVLPNQFPAGTRLTGTEAVAASFNGWRHTAMGAIRRSLYNEAFERFGMPEAGMCSDEVFTRHILACAREVVITDAVYVYTSNPESVTRRRSLKLFDCIECAFASLALSNLIGSREVWRGASTEFFNAFLSMVRLYHTFEFDTEDDRNDVRLRLRNMFDRLGDERFRRAIPLSHRLTMKAGFGPYMKIIELYDRTR